MTIDTRAAGCMAIAIVLLVSGTLLTGVLPATAPYQVVAGGVIVGAFALVFYCLRD